MSTEWNPIDTAPENIWDPILLRLRGANGEEAVGSYGYEDESVTDDGDVFIVGAWHLNGNIHKTLGFDPVEWAPLDK